MVTNLRQATPRSRQPYWFIGIALVTLAVTLGSLSNPFILDDTSKIQDNTDIRNLREINSRLVYPYETNQLLERNDPSRPLVFLTYALIYHFSQKNPVGYRLVNLLLHSANAALVFLLLLAAFQRWRPAPDAHTPVDSTPWAAMVGALYYGLAPIHTGTAIYCYGLTDVLSAFLMLLTLVLHHQGGPRRWPLLCIALALLTKQSAAVLPALLAVWDLGVRWDFRWDLLKRHGKSYWPYVAIVLTWLLWRLAYFGALGDIEGRGNTTPWYEYALFQPYALLKYLLLSLWPSGLAIDHHLLRTNIPPLWKWLAIAVVAIALGVWLRHSWRVIHGSRSVRWDPLWLAVTAYLIILAPTSSIMPLVDLVVERRVYLANVALAGVLGALAARLVGRWHRVGLSVTAVVLVLLGGVSLHRNHVFASNETAWKSVLALYPDSVRALTNLGTHLSSEGRDEEAKRYFEILIAGNSNDVYAISNLASLYNKEESPFFDRIKAQELFTKVITLKPDFFNAFYNLGRIHQLAGRSAEAEQMYQQVLKLYPRHVQAHNNLGLIYRTRGQFAEAREAFETALRLDPEYPQARHNLALGERADRPPAADLSQPGPSEVPVNQVDPSILLPMFERELEKNPSNEILRRQYEDYCRARSLSCEKK